MIKTCIYCKSPFKSGYTLQKFCSVRCSNRYNLNNLSKVILPKKSSALAEFIGIFLGDGTLSPYYTAIYLHSIADKNYIEYVKSLCGRLFEGASVTVHKKKSENCIVVQINSVSVVRFLLRMGLATKAIPAWIYKRETYIRACIRGLFDTEGSISFKTYKSRKGIRVYKQLNFRNANSQLIKFVRNNLKSLGFRPTMTLKRSLYLSTHEGIGLFRHKVGFNNPKLIERSLVNNWLKYKIWRGSGAVIPGGLENR